MEIRKRNPIKGGKGGLHGKGKGKSRSTSQEPFSLWEDKKGWQDKPSWKQDSRNDGSWKSDGHKEGKWKQDKGWFKNWAQHQKARRGAGL